MLDNRIATFRLQLINNDMKYLITFLSSILLGSFSFGQLMNRIETSCELEERSVLGSLNAGKAVMVMGTGFDCSICQSHAASIKLFSEEHDNIEVWGAMRWQYSQDPENCNDIANWNQSYAWDDLFTFLDTGDAWIQLGTPYFYVFSPENNELIFQGSDIEDAFNEAINASQFATSVKHVQASDYMVMSIQGGVELKSRQNFSLHIYNLQGSLVFEGQSAPFFSVSTLKTGAYILRIKTETKTFTEKHIVY